MESSPSDPALRAVLYERVRPFDEALKASTQAIRRSDRVPISVVRNVSAQKDNFELALADLRTSPPEVEGFNPAQVMWGIGALTEHLQKTTVADLLAAVTEYGERRG